ncbi:hypothetical protein PENTCL1PPCAC_7645, partial [Pristionchus entomophagus]
SSICLVCSSPTANSLHFGARTCKACAAFFRRTISMGMNYACTTEDASIPCKIHYHLRMICRACRFEKCLRAGMKEGMVQKKLDEEKKSSSPKCRKRLMTEQTASSSYGSREVKTELRDDEPVPSEPTQERRSASTSRDLFDFHTPLTNSDDVIAHYRASEMGLHDRRRMLHGSCSLHDLFDDREDAPFRREHLRPFNITTFSGPSRPDLMCIMEQTRELSLFKRLAMRSDKTLIVRYVLSVDYVLSSAFLTEKLGIEEDILVLNDATFLKMKPLPLTGYEENARAQFKSNQEWETNKAFMPLFIRKWSEVIIPYFEMRLSFTEYVLLKTLTVYQMVHYRLTEDGKTLCSQHRDLIISALHRTAELEGLHDPVQRVGEIILLMSTIMNYTSSLIGRYFKITLCNQFSAGNEIKIDSMIQEMCSYQF